MKLTKILIAFIILTLALLANCEESSNGEVSESQVQVASETADDNAISSEISDELASTIDASETAESTEAGSQSTTTEIIEEVPENSSQQVQGEESQVSAGSTDSTEPSESEITDEADNSTEASEASSGPTQDSSSVHQATEAKNQASKNENSKKNSTPTSKTEPTKVQQSKKVVPVTPSSGLSVKKNLSIIHKVLSLQRQQDAMERKAERLFKQAFQDVLTPLRLTKQMPGARPQERFSGNLPGVSRVKGKLAQLQSRDMPVKYTYTF